MRRGCGGGGQNDKTNTMHNVKAAYFPSSSYSWYSSVNRVEVAVVAMVGAVRGEPEPWGKTAAAAAAGSRTGSERRVA